MKTIRIVAVLAAAVMAGHVCLADFDLVTNVYAKANAVHEGNGQLPYDYFLGVRGGGFLNDGMTDKFVSFCGFVSNRCNEIVADWPAYETNEVVRFTVHSAIGFSGFSNLTNLAERVLTLCEANSGAISSESLKMIRVPYGTPFDSEEYLALNIQVPGVSNIVQRLRCIEATKAHTNAVIFCDSCLSGERKEWVNDMKAAGAL